MEKIYVKKEEEEEDEVEEEGKQQMERSVGLILTKKIETNSLMPFY